MNVSAFIEKCVEIGISIPHALEAGKIYEAAVSQAVDEALEARRANEAQRSARYRERGGGKIPHALRVAVFERDGYACVYCGSDESLQCDHVEPVSKGGPTTMENLATACRVCNARKRDRDRKAFSRLVRGNSSDKTGHPGNSENASRVVYTSLPSEEVITSEPNGSSVVVLARDPETKSPKSRGTRLPDDWEPSGADIEVARSEGLTDEEIARAVREFRNYWCARSGRDATKVSWSRTWENRCIELSRRLRGNREKLAARPAQAGGGGRGAVSFADIYARRHGYAQD